MNPGTPRRQPQLALAAALYCSSGGPRRARDVGLNAEDQVTEVGRRTMRDRHRGLVLRPAKRWRERAYSHRQHGCQPWRIGRRHRRSRPDLALAGHIATGASGRPMFPVVGALGAHAMMRIPVPMVLSRVCLNYAGKTVTACAGGWAHAAPHSHVRQPGRGQHDRNRPAAPKSAKRCDHVSVIYVTLPVNRVQSCLLTIPCPW